MQPTNGAEQQTPPSVQLKLVCMSEAWETLMVQEHYYPVTWIRGFAADLSKPPRNTPTAGNIRNIRHLRMRGDKPVSTGRTNGGAERRPSYPGDQRVKHANRATKIWVKVAMGIAYFLCVSIAAFFLAIYYVFFWTPDGHNNATKTNGSFLHG